MVPPATFAMSQAPSPLEPAVGRRSRRQRHAPPVERASAPVVDLQAPALRRQSARRRGPSRLLTFAVGLAAGYTIGQGGIQPLASSLGALVAGLQQAPAHLPHLLQPFGLGQRRVLVLGSDMVGGNTDVMFAVQVDKGITNITQVPRDTYVETAEHGVLKANALYGVMGPVAAQQAVANLMGVPVERHLKVNLAAVSKVADALGGVEVTVPKRMYYEDRAQDLLIDLYPGTQVLRGNELEGFLRFRNDEMGDLGRMERQRLVIRKVFSQLAQPATLTRLPALLKIAGEDIHTNLSPLEITQLITTMGRTRLSTERLPGREYWADDLSYWMPASNTHHPSGSGEPPP